MVVSAFISVTLELVGTLLLIEALKPFAPVLLAEIPIAMVGVIGVCAWAIVVLLEQDVARERWSKIICAAFSPITKLRRGSQKISEISAV